MISSNQDDSPFNIRDAYLPNTRHTNTQKTDKTEPDVYTLEQNPYRHSNTTSKTNTQKYSAKAHLHHIQLSNREFSPYSSSRPQLTSNSTASPLNRHQTQLKNSKQTIKVETVKPQSKGSPSKRPTTTGTSKAPDSPRKVTKSPFDITVSLATSFDYSMDIKSTRDVESAITRTIPDRDVPQSKPQTQSTIKPPRDIAKARLQLQGELQSHGNSRETPVKIAGLAHIPEYPNQQHSLRIKESEDDSGRRKVYTPFLESKGLRGASNSKEVEKDRLKAKKLESPVKEDREKEKDRTPSGINSKHVAQKSHLLNTSRDKGYAKSRTDISEGGQTPKNGAGNFKEAFLKRSENVPASKTQIINESISKLTQTREMSVGLSSIGNLPKGHKSQREASSNSPARVHRSSLSSAITEKGPMKESRSGLSLLIKKTSPAPQVFLSEDEKAQYGDRNVSGYDKFELLGKGGFALVWKGLCKSNGKNVAMKQMLKNSVADSRKTDLHYGQLLFRDGGQPREEFAKHPGIQSIAVFYEYKVTKQDEWHISELCGRTLSSLLFDIKGEFVKGERVYGVKHLELHRHFRTDGQSLRLFLKKMAEVLDLFSANRIVHNDIKPENLLIGDDGVADLKLIDFGSAYNWADRGAIKAATPEYMPPEVLNILLGRNGGDNTLENLAKMGKPWSVDVWSLGTVLLEIITGIPLWIPLKCKVNVGSKKGLLRYGILAAKGRDYDKIYNKQKVLIENLSGTLAEYLEGWSDSELLLDLLTELLRWDPAKRISPAGILKHPYIRMTRET